MTAPLSPRQRAEVLAAETLTHAGAPDGRALAGELFGRLAREGLLVVDEPVRRPIGGRHRRGPATS